MRNFSASLLDFLFFIPLAMGKWAEETRLGAQEILSPSCTVFHHSRQNFRSFFIATSLVPPSPRFPGSQLKARFRTRHRRLYRPALSFRLLSRHRHVCLGPFEKPDRGLHLGRRFLLFLLHGWRGTRACQSPFMAYPLPGLFERSKPFREHCPRGSRFSRRDLLFKFDRGFSLF